MNRSIITICLCTLLFLSGCSSYYNRSIPKSEHFYLNPEKDLTTIGRVAFVDLGNNSDYMTISTDVNKSLFYTIQKKQVFGLVAIRQTDPAWKSLQQDIFSSPADIKEPAGMNLTAQYSLKELSSIRKTLKCNAILVGNITQFRPFPHMSIGLRMKLIDLRDGQLLWALEQIWDASDKSTGDRIKKYYKRGGWMTRPSLQDELGTVSPIKFIKFVTYEIADTLEPRGY